MQDNIIENGLIQRLKKGDKSAFTIIFSAYYVDLVLFVSNLSNIPDVAEEIVQDTFVKIWEEHEYLNISVSLKSYLLRAVKNRWIDWYRHQQVIQRHSSEVLKSEIQYSHDADSYILKSELEQKIESVLMKMPEEIASTFRMHRYNGLKYNEIALELMVSVRTVEVRISKALLMLHEELKLYFEG